MISVKVIKDTPPETTLKCGDCIRFTESTQDNYYALVTQTDYDTLTLFCLDGLDLPISFNRMKDPVKIDWKLLTTESITKIYPEITNVVKVYYDMTITIKG